MFAIPSPATQILISPEVPAMGSTIRVSDFPLAPSAALEKECANPTSHHVPIGSGGRL